VIEEPPTDSRKSAGLSPTLWVSSLYISPIYMGYYLHRLSLRADTANRERSAGLQRDICIAKVVRVCEKVGMHCMRDCPVADLASV
jgi:hypothetical protein